MRGLFLLIFTCFTITVMAQNADSLKRADAKPKTEQSEQSKDKNESFGDYVQKVGLSIWGRVKERFNLDAVVENLEEKKDKFLGDKDKKVVEEKKEEQLKEGEKKELKNNGGT